jgi:hypothetical protein
LHGKSDPGARYNDQYLPVVKVGGLARKPRTFLGVATVLVRGHHGQLKLGPPGALRAGPVYGERCHGQVARQSRVALTVGASEQDPDEQLRSSTAVTPHDVCSG